MNVLFILLDDLGWNDIGTHNKIVKTPNIDHIVNDGCKLNANYTFPVCGPTRAMIQTGFYAYKLGMQKLFDPWVEYGLDVNLKIIPQYLKNYRCFAIGKWHLGHCKKKFLPHARGYHYHYGNLTGCIHHLDHHHINPCECSRLHDFSENGKPIYPKGHASKILTDKVLEILDEKIKNKFIYLAYLDPHAPLICPKEYEDIYKNEKLSESRKKYLGMVSHVDFQIGRILNKLKENKVYDDTLIWIMSDNGGWTLDWAGGDNHPFRGGKASFYEGGSRTFSVLKHNKIKIKEYNNITHCVDVLPTIADFCNLNLYNEKLDGKSLYDNLVKNKNTEDRIITLGFFGENHWCFIIDNLKFIKLKKTSNHHMGIAYGQFENEDINFIECYDLCKDKEEKTNIIKEKFNKYKNILEKQIKYCLKERVYENFKKYNKEEVEEICKNLKFWGDQNSKKIKLLNFKKINFKKESLEYINSKDSLESLTGYDIFTSNKDQ